MKSLTETQCDELIHAVLTGEIDYCNLVVLDRRIYEHWMDKLLLWVECPNERCAHNVLKAIGHLPGCPSC